MTKLYPYQIKGVKEILRLNGRALLADEMGLGKTIQALWFLKKHPGSFPALVLCPANAKWVWEEQAAQHTRIRSQILSGKTPDKNFLRRRVPLTICNYDILKAWYDVLKEFRYQTLILDEWVKLWKVFKRND